MKLQIGGEKFVPKKNHSFYQSLLLTSSLVWLMSFFLVNSMFALGSTQEANAKELLKLCYTVDHLSVEYQKALTAHENLIQSFIDRMNKGEVHLNFPMDKLKVEDHFGNVSDAVLGYERTYHLYAKGVEGQAQVVDQVKRCQREMKRIEVFTKAFSEYVNMELYFSDSRKNEGLLLFDKILGSIQGLKEEVIHMRVEIKKLKTKNEKVLLRDHDLKRILEPMISDVEFLELLLLETEKGEDINNYIEKIKTKRTEIAQSKEKRQKEIGYLLNGGDKPGKCNVFYQRYQSVLTKMQNILEDPQVNVVQIREQWDVISVSMDQLIKTYETIKK